jgi:glutathione S-transferase
MAEPIVYGPDYSTYARTVRLALEEKGVSYELHPVDIFSGAHTLPEHVARQPFAKVPAFEHDGLVLYETRAITGYVNDTFEGPDLRPADTRDRARMEQFISIIDCYAYPAIVGQIVVQRLVVPLQGGTPDEAAIADAVPTARKCVDAIENAIGDGPFLAGASLSLADLHVIPVYDYFRQTPEGERALANAPKLERWWGTVGERGSVAKTAPSLG